MQKSFFLDLLSGNWMGIHIFCAKYNIEGEIFKI